MVMVPSISSSAATTCSSSTIATVTTTSNNSIVIASGNVNVSTPVSCIVFEYILIFCTYWRKQLANIINLIGQVVQLLTRLVNIAYKCQIVAMCMHDHSCRAKQLLLHQDSHDAVITIIATATTCSSEAGVTNTSTEPLSSTSLVPVTTSTVSCVVYISTHNLAYYYMPLPHLPFALHISFSQHCPVLSTSCLYKWLMELSFI